MTLSVSIPTPGAGAGDEYRVEGVSGAALTEAGYQVIDDYGTFATALLTPSEASALEADGHVVTLLDHTTGRGGLRFDAVAEPGPLTGLDYDTQHWLVQFRGPVKADWFEALDHAAVAVYDYLPHFTFLVWMPQETASYLAEQPEVRSVIPYDAAFKVSDDLPTTGLVEATVLVFRDADLPSVLRDIRANGALVLDFGSTRLDHVVDVLVRADHLPRLAHLDSVSWIEPRLNEITLDNAESSAITQSGGMNVYTIHDKGVDGRSQKVSVCDTGVNTAATQIPPVVANLLGIRPIRMDHEMYDDVTGQGIIVYNHHLEDPIFDFDHRKVDLYYSPQENGNRGDHDDADGHGTHTAGTIAGDKPVYGQRDGNDGVAFAAQLLVCDITNGFAFQILTDYANYWDPAYDRGARINSNSWGNPHTNSYTNLARMHDDYVTDHRDFLILRSMGNTGSSGSIRPEAVAKSAMGIGATDNGNGMENLASFSTGGLTTDGRIKPNVVAPGNCLDSAGLSYASYVCFGGTSMSTPTVAGAAALIRDYLERGFYPSGAANDPDGFNPSSALVRAMLQISGKEISGDRGQTDFPNKAQGWGRVLLDDVLYFSGDARDLVLVDEGTGLSTGGVDTHTVTVSAGTPLRVMVAWSDVPGAAGANPALVNNLDLVVSGPGGTYIGNHFVGNQVPAGPFAADARNVEEAVYINAPAAGTYTITVSGANVPSGPQPYALVVTGDLS